MATCLIQVNSKYLSENAVNLIKFLFLIEKVVDLEPYEEIIAKEASVDRAERRARASAGAKVGEREEEEDATSAESGDKEGEFETEGEAITVPHNARVNKPPPAKRPRDGNKGKSRAPIILVDEGAKVNNFCPIRKALMRYLLPSCSHTRFTPSQIMRSLFSNFFIFRFQREIHGGRRLLRSSRGGRLLTIGWHSSGGANHPEAWAGR